MKVVKYIEVTYPGYDYNPNLGGPSVASHMGKTYSERIYEWHSEYETTLQRIRQTNPKFQPSEEISLI